MSLRETVECHLPRSVLEIQFHLVLQTLNCVGAVTAEQIVQELQALGACAQHFGAAVPHRDC